MKCDELKAYRNLEGSFNTETQTDTVIAEDYEGNYIEFDEDDEVYLKDEVDAAIAELKQKLHDAEMQADLAECAVTEYKIDCAKLNDKNRRLKRALWLARAERALEKIAWFKLWNASISTMDPEDGDRQEFDKWKKALGKFLAKAEEYR